MGQYYKPVNVDKKEWLYSHDFKSRFNRNDGKVMYLGEGLKLMEHSYIGNKLMNAVESLLIPDGKWYKCRLVWAGDYADDEKGAVKGDNLFEITDKVGKKIRPSSKPVNKKYHYLTNHTKKQVIDLNSVKPDNDGWKIHPLSLLVCEGNGRGGGDYHGTDTRIGTWARDSVSLEDHIIEDYKLVDGQFIEDRR